MIGVVFDPADLPVVAEFFELFKTAWEPAVAGRSYNAVIGLGESDAVPDAAVTIMFGATPRSIERRFGVSTRVVDGPAVLEWRGARLPLYEGALQFNTAASPGGARCDGQLIEYRVSSGRHTTVRVGVDLVAEIRHLLNVGQPVAEALTPTLEWHIALLRSVLIDCGVEFVEVPPRPFGHDFVCCLTHDVDFYGITRHVFDRTMLGFAYRASIGTLVDVAKGRRPIAHARRNGAAVAMLPLAWAGVVRDPWQPLDDYAAAEPPSWSTFFVVPFRNRPGLGPDNRSAPGRAVAYQASDVSHALRAAVSRGSEVAVHGIDAWRDAAAAVEERTEVSTAAAMPATGIRMHWLFWDAESPARLEASEYAYDSTCGYNEAVGYRAGTSQVFRPLNTRTLLELPLSIMDTALLFPGRMNLSTSAALTVCEQIVTTARRFGGTVVVNWHDRSLSPERLWDDCYRRLLATITAGSCPWFATAGQSVEWFRWRRSIRFLRIGTSADVQVDALERPATVPPAVVVKRGAAVANGAGVEEQVFDGAVLVA